MGPRTRGSRRQSTGDNGGILAALAADNSSKGKIKVPKKQSTKKDPSTELGFDEDISLLAPSEWSKDAGDDHTPPPSKKSSQKTPSSRPDAVIISTLLSPDFSCVSALSPDAGGTSNKKMHKVPSFDRTMNNYDDAPLQPKPLFPDDDDSMSLTSSVANCGDDLSNKREERGEKESFRNRISKKQKGVREDESRTSCSKSDSDEKDGVERDTDDDDDNSQSSEEHEFESVAEDESVSEEQNSEDGMDSDAFINDSSSEDFEEEESDYELGQSDDEEDEDLEFDFQDEKKRPSARKAAPAVASSKKKVGKTMAEEDKTLNDDSDNEEEIIPALKPKKICAIVDSDSDDDESASPSLASQEDDVASFAKPLVASHRKGEDAASLAQPSRASLGIEEEDVASFAQSSHASCTSLQGTEASVSPLRPKDADHDDGDETEDDSTIVLDSNSILTDDDNDDDSCIAAAADDDEVEIIAEILTDTHINDDTELVVAVVEDDDDDAVTLGSDKCCSLANGPHANHRQIDAAEEASVSIESEKGYLANEARIDDVKKSTVETAAALDDDASDTLIYDDPEEEVEVEDSLVNDLKNLTMDGTAVSDHADGEGEDDDASDTLIYDNPEEEEEAEDSEDNYTDDDGSETLAYGPIDEAKLGYESEVESELQEEQTIVTQKKLVRLVTNEDKQQQETSNDAEEKQDESKSVVADGKIDHEDMFDEDVDISLAGISFPEAGRCTDEENIRLNKRGIVNEAMTEKEDAEIMFAGLSLPETPGKKNHVTSYDGDAETGDMMEDEDDDELSFTPCLQDEETGEREKLASYDTEDKKEVMSEDDGDGFSLTGVSFAESESCIVAGQIEISCRANELKTSNERLSLNQQSQIDAANIDCSPIDVIAPMVTFANSTSNDAVDSGDKENQAIILKKTRTKGRKLTREGSVRKGKWSLGSKIGTGSFGVVHVGMNMHTGQLMAVKKIELSPAAMKDVKTEVGMLKSLSHVNIVRYLGAERDDEKLYIFQEWVPGGSVTTLLNKFGSFSASVMRSYLSQILTGLAYLHDNRILHRDIKGGNVLINDDGIVKLADFGAAKRIAHQQGDMMESMTMRGTPYFMAPEVFEEHYNSKADIWSVGCVAFQMATGTAPWREEGFTNPMSLFLHLQNSEGMPLLNWPQDGHMQDSNREPFESMLKRCFWRESTQRPTAHGLLADGFFTCASSSEDDCSESQALFSTGGDTLFSTFTPAKAKAPGKTPRTKGTPPLAARSPRTPFLSPPLPNRIRTSFASQVSPLMTHSPNVDAKDWPTWAREQLKEEMTSPSIQRPSPIASPLMDSLAFSTDTNVVSNPFARPARTKSAALSPLDGLQFLDINQT